MKPKYKADKIESQKIQSETSTSELALTGLGRKSRYLRGWPGYRHRDSRFGLDPFDTQNELAHMQGVFIRQILTGQFRTSNPIYLFFMIVIGLFAISPLIVSIISIVSNGEWQTLQIAALFSIHIALGFGLLINVILSFVYWGSNDFPNDMHDDAAKLKASFISLACLSPLFLSIYITYIYQGKFPVFGIIQNNLAQILLGMGILLAVIDSSKTPARDESDD